MLNFIAMFFSFAACPLLDAKFNFDALFFCGLSASRCQILFRCSFLLRLVRFSMLNFTSDFSFFNCCERLHCRILAAVGLFERGLLAAGWRQCCVLRSFIFFIFFCQNLVWFFSVKILFFLSKPCLNTPLSIFCFWGYFL
jgi:hypothetical protein